MSLLRGTYSLKKKNGDVYYKSKITFKNKHISLGSFPTEILANQAYREASQILVSNKYIFENYHIQDFALSFHKWVTLMNFRDNGMYIKTPIYLSQNFLEYYYDMDLVFKFDIDDLFFYSTHKIMKRGGYLFVADYGMQINILSRYGIKNFAVPNRDYKFVNGDNTDYRYANIVVINRYYGVQKCIRKGMTTFQVKIHINGDTIVGSYNSEITAAVAFNRAADMLSKRGCTKNFPRNYIEEINVIEYAKLYNGARISKSIRDWSEPTKAK